MTANGKSGKQQIAPVSFVSQLTTTHNIGFPEPHLVKDHQYVDSQELV
jgi:hypothetical protein